MSWTPEHRKAKRLERTASGLCRYDGAPAVTGRRLCRRCLDADAKRCRTEKRKAWQRTRRRARIAARLCVDCPAPAAPMLIRCVGCAFTRKLRAAGVST